MIDWHNIVAGALVGLMVGMTGVGGGSLMSPILILLLGVPPTTAVGTDLWFAGITKSVGSLTHHSQDHVDWPVVLWLAVGSLPAAVLTLITLNFADMHQLRDGLIMQALGIVLILTAIVTLFRLTIVNRVLRMTPRAARERASLKRPLTIASGALLGLLVTLTSVGAGALGVTLLLILYPLRLTAKRLVGTDIAHAVPLTMLAGLGYLMNGHLDLLLLGSLLIGSVPAIIVGARLSAILPERIVQRALAAILAIAGIRMIFH